MRDLLRNTKDKPLKSPLSNKDNFSNYKNHKALISAEFINNLDLELNENIKIFHVGFGSEHETSSNGHIKGSIYINTDEVEPPPSWKLANAEILTEFAKKYGLHKDQTVIITAWNQMASFRVATILLYMGVQDVRVLNGGLSTLKSIGYKFETKSNLPQSNLYFGCSIPANPNIIISTEELKILLKDENFTLIDNRTWLEHIGKISGYDYHNKKARIPGSIYGYAGLKGSHSLDYYRNEDNTMKSKEEIEALWLSQGINLTNKLAFICGSGWRASEVYFYAYVIGYENISIYSDGWIGWSNDKNNPSETGIPTLK